jgi:methylmalonyl-CoA mutase
MPAVSGIAPGAIAKVRQQVEQFLAREGRRPRILVAKLGQDGHDRGQEVVATAFGDFGFDVDVGPSAHCSRHLQKPLRPRLTTMTRSSASVHLRAGHLTLVPALRRALQKLGRDDILIVVGGVIPPQDYNELYKNRAAAIFGPGSVLTQCALRVLELLGADAHQEQAQSA